ncbi:MAG: HAD-IA family hydrolase [Alphaproteobacteria bacterium]|nr:HAD-IA family hydrolase [Alphaproteobacteria bacterium]
MRLHDFAALSFDCYGTLIDWESGILAALAAWLAPTGPLDGATLLAAFAEAEAEQQAATPDLRYPAVLAAVHGRLAQRFARPVAAGAAERFGAAIAEWPAFPDSAAALGYLKRHYRLIVLSNVDRTSFQASNARLGVTFDAICTAEDIGSYKPDRRNFAYLLAEAARLGVPRERLLHAAQSLYHDHVPAHAMGIATAWIDRRQGRGGGATKPPAGPVHYGFRFSSLAELAAAHRAEATGRP